MTVADALAFDTQTSGTQRRNVGLWLLVIAALIAVMVVVGGLTRLTGSGLSITEWQPVTGVLPPLSEAAWQAEFAKYQGTPQYELINRGLGLVGFKTLYWWEWAHRLIGRLLGVVFLIPFLWFVKERRIDRALAVRLAGIFLLGGAQGVVGWWMVESGLGGTRVVVSQYRLAAHLGLAIVLFGYILWTALEVMGVGRTKIAAAKALRPWVFLLAGLIFVQVLLGALMSGLHAGLAFDTWPTYAGRWVPPGLYSLSPWWLNHFENPALVHFQHRTVAYAVAVLAIGLYAALRRLHVDKPARLAAAHVVAFTLVQIGLGVLAVVSRVWLPLAALHQLGALAVLGATLWLLYVLHASAQRAPA